VINADKPYLWKADIAASVDQYNQWFMIFAPKAFRETRQITTEKVRIDLERTGYMSEITPTTLAAYPDILSTLRMMTAPPLARDRLIGLAGVSSSLVARLEAGKLPIKMSADDLSSSLKRICSVIVTLMDSDLFPWVGRQTSPAELELYRSATVVADRMCGAVADPIIRNAQEIRQLSFISTYLNQKGYEKITMGSRQPIRDMSSGSYAFRHNLVVGREKRVNIPIDVMIQPLTPQENGLPILIEAKSAGDFTNTNKRRKEEATKIRQIREEYGATTRMILFLCGYFDDGYLGYEAAEGLDWVWEHRIDDLALAGV